jgi:hypothetical protein
MNRFPQAVFRAGGAELIEGEAFTSRMVQDEAEFDAAQAEGFHATTDEAIAAKLQEPAAADEQDDAADNAPPTRAELELKAKELGIAFKPHTSDKKLGEAIDAKLAEQAQ